MAFLKFSRDKRGYEHFYLVQPSGNREKSRPRVLYWFRTPPNIKVGREPFDDEMRRAIAAQNPGVAFDWPKLLETPIPPDIEHWRDRRRAEKAARRLARGEVEAEPEEKGTGIFSDVQLPAATGSSSEVEVVASDAEKGTGIFSEAQKEPRPRKRRRRRRRGSQPGAPTPPPTPEPPPDEPDSDV